MVLTEAEDIKKRWQEYTDACMLSRFSQLCPTLCNPVDGSPPDSSRCPQDSLGKNTGVGCHFLLLEYTEELYKKHLHDPDNHDGVVTHLEPDILECKVKKALRSITTNKASGGDGIPAELFQTLKDDAVKVLHSICQQIWKTQQWPQDWKNSIFIPMSK